MRFEPHEIDALADAIAEKLLPRMLAAMSEQHHQAGDTSTDDNDRLLNSIELGERLGLCEATVRAHAKAGKIPSIRLERRLLFDYQAVKTALQKAAD